MNFAALKRLPVVFVCENNLYSVYSPLSVRQPPGREVVEMAKAHGMEGFQGDGNDVIEVSRLAAQAIQNARTGGGPTFLEFKTYRWREHCGPNYDNDLGYRTEREFEEWKARCPIQQLQRRLMDERLLSEEVREQFIAVVEQELDEAVAFAKESPFPEEALLFEHAYAP
jgi:pyruvate dehydrogenase E1 component alpha subunit